MSEWGDKLLTEADNAQLRAENEKLRERVHELEIEYDGATTAVLEKTERIEWLAGRLRGETNENDKLRELVRDMWPHVRHRSRMCRECELPCDTSDECLLYEPMRQRMAELGIEADA